MPKIAGGRVAAKMGAPFFWPFFPLRPLFPMENVNFFGIFFLDMIKAVFIPNRKPFATIFMNTFLRNLMKPKISLYGLLRI